MINTLDSIRSEVYFISRVPVLGWMDPHGRFFLCRFAEHEEKAKEIIQNKGWFEEWAAAYAENKATYGDYLCAEKGYVLVDSHTFLHKEGQYPVCITGVRISNDQNKALWNKYFASAPQETKLLFIQDAEKWQ